MRVNKLGGSEPKFEKAIGYLLIIGVIISLLLEIVGVVILYRSYGNLNISQDANMYIKGRDFFSFIYQQITEKHTTNAILFMTAGIIVLILTPYVRVIASVFYFAWQRNIRYVLVTLFVLVVVTLSLAFH
ncbi:MAG: DUF1634 domain-containing protein [Chloroflexi bacterium]|nr:DUF1634 domain-containing protein [Chloroflexota bacterium]